MGISREEAEVAAQNRSEPKLHYYMRCLVSEYWMQVESRSRSRTVNSRRILQADIQPSAL